MKEMKGSRGMKPWNWKEFSFFEYVWYGREGKKCGV